MSHTRKDGANADRPNTDRSSQANGPDAMLIATKLRMPPARRKMLFREHLIRRLSEEKERRLIFVAGPAGCGKTSLVSQWIKHDLLPAAWYSLDRTDNESDLFFRYLLTTLADVDVALAGPLRSILAVPGLLTGRDLIPFLIEQFGNISGDIYIVLDDYHVIESREIHDALLYLLEHTPPKVHIVVLSRHALPLPVSRFKVRNLLLEVSGSDMRFTEAEATEFLKGVMDLDLSDGEVHRLVDYTEGWAGGLQLFGLSLRSKPVPKGPWNIPAMAMAETADFLIEEVVEAQPDKTKLFLRTTALLERFNADLCREVTGDPDAADILDHLYRNNVFLVPLDEDRVWYRYHHLFSGVIRRSVRTSSPRFYQDVHRRAALWFAAGGYLEDAFRHAFISEDLEFAANLLEEHLLLSSDRFGYGGGARWIAKVPYDILNHRILLKLHDCGQKVEGFRLTEIEKTLAEIQTNPREAFERYSGSKRTACEDLFTYLSHAVPYYYRGPEHADIERLNQACDMISRENRQFSGYLKMTVAFSYSCQGAPLKAADALREASAIMSSTDSIWGRVVCWRYSAAVEGTQGHLHRAEETLKKAFQTLDVKSVADSPIQFLLHLPMAWVHYYHNELEEAEACAARALHYSERAGIARDIIEGLLLNMLICLAKGDLDGAWESAEKGYVFTKGLDASDIGSIFDGWRARLSIRRGNLEAAVKWTDRRKLSFAEPFSIHFLSDCMAWAEMLYWQGLYRETADMLERLRRQCSDRNLLMHVLEIDLLHGAALHSQGDYRGAREDMERALQFAEPERCLSAFVSYRPVIAPLLLALARIESRRSAPFFLAVMRACGIGLDDTVTPKGLAEPEFAGLTAREMGVLKLMSAGHTNQEIAEKFFVSLHTVKSHVKHIYAKLGVTTRTQAARRFEELKAAGFVGP